MEVFYSQPIELSTAGFLLQHLRTRVTPDGPDPKRLS